MEHGTWKELRYLKIYLAQESSANIEVSWRNHKLSMYVVAAKILEIKKYIFQDEINYADRLDYDGITTSVVCSAYEREFIDQNLAAKHQCFTRSPLVYFPIPISAYSASR